MSKLFTMALVVFSAFGANARTISCRTNSLNISFPEYAGYGDVIIGLENEEPAKITVDGANSQMTYAFEDDTESKVLGGTFLVKNVVVRNSSFKTILVNWYDAGSSSAYSTFFIQDKNGISELSQGSCSFGNLTH